MKLQKLKGNTYYLKLEQNHTLLNCGLTHGVLIDTGISGNIAKSILDSIYSSGEKVDYILNTHAHIDHSGGNYTAQAITGADLFATKEQQPYIEQDGLLEIFCYGAEPPMRAAGIAKKACKTAKVDKVIEHGQLKLDNTNLKIIPTIGHSLDHTVIESEDDVLFCGDILMSQDLIEVHKIQLLFNVEQMQKDLDFLEQSNYSYYVHSHVPFGEDHLSLIKKNRQIIDDVSSLIYEFCKLPRGREEVTGYLIRSMNILGSPSRYVLVNMSVGAYLSYLFSKGKITLLFEEGILKYIQK